MVTNEALVGIAVAGANQALIAIGLAVAIFAVKLTIQGRVWINPEEKQKAGRQATILGVITFVFGLGTIITVSFTTPEDIWRLWGELIVLAISIILGFITADTLRREMNRHDKAMAANVAAKPAVLAEPKAPDQQPAPATVNITIPPSPDKTISITLTIT